LVLRLLDMNPELAMAALSNSPLEWPDALNRPEEQQQSGTDRMVAAGRLLGGVVHDFANVLTLISGYAELLLNRVSVEDGLRPELEEIRKAAAHGARLTTQLLTFSRGQTAGVQPVDLNSVVTELAGMLGLVIGEHVELELDLQPVLDKVMADPGQMEQVVMNLVLNARDAMPTGGHIRIETREGEIREATALEYGIPGGRCVMLSVIDNGRGIASELLPHIFEPFFTTKGEGKGTGLGLSTVQRIVKEAGGGIRAQSVQGKGATFTIFLPALVHEGANGALRAEPQLVDAAALRERPFATRMHGGETLLVVEDEEDVRRLLTLILRKRGYQVLEASCGQEALRIFEQHAAGIDLVLTDMVMPQISGRQLGEMLEKMRPGIKIVYMSGYTDDVLVRTGALRPGMSFLQKPLRPETLASKIREALDTVQIPALN
jgi:two-component system, cell cycle sensor histidine kinase and response regulator CckA